MKNIEIMDKYIHKLGVSPNWTFTEIVSLTSESLNSIARPVKAVILLFQCSQAYEAYFAIKQEKLMKKPPTYPKDLFYMKQLSCDSCGSIALVHSIANNADITLHDGALKTYLNSARSLTPDERIELFEKNDSFASIHFDLDELGYRSYPVKEKDNHHFVVFVNKDNIIYELDGRKSCPINHGKTTEKTFFQDAIAVCTDFMSCDPGEVSFTMFALTPNKS